MPNSEVIISIHPKWCERIANGIKTIEVRKTVPQITVPFKCYIYCTKRNDEILALPCKGAPQYEITKRQTGGRTAGNGFVIGEFTCDTIEKYVVVCDDVSNDMIYKRSDDIKWFAHYVSEIDFSKLCLSQEQLKEYGGGQDLYGWRISNLVLYKEPKNLQSFGFARAPQSWMYHG